MATYWLPLFSQAEKITKVSPYGLYYNAVAILILWYPILPVQIKDNVKFSFSGRHKDRHMQVVNTILLPEHVIHIYVATLLHSCICSQCSLPMWMLLQGVRNGKIFPSWFPLHSLFICICLRMSCLCQMSQQRCNCSLIWLVSCASVSYCSQGTRVAKSMISVHKAHARKGV